MPSGCLPFYFSNPKDEQKVLGSRARALYSGTFRLLLILTLMLQRYGPIRMYAYEFANGLGWEYGSRYSQVTLFCFKKFQKIQVPKREKK